MGSHILSLITFLPLLGALVVALLPRGGHAALRGATLVFSLANLLLSLTVFGVDPNGGMSFKESAEWIPSLGIHYALGIDGIAMPPA